VVNFYFVEPQRQAIPVVPIKVAFTSGTFDVLTETVELLIAVLSPLDFKDLPPVMVFGYLSFFG
jgi:hypothetical protein